MPLPPGLSKAAPFPDPVLGNTTFEDMLERCPHCGRLDRPKTVSLL